MNEKAGEEGTGLIRRLGLFDSTMMMVGIFIGSGIFLITSIMAKSIPSGGYILLAWEVGGLLVLAGALTFAELGASFPQAGGQYIYLKEAYGPWAGFLFGWILCLVSMGGAIAAAAVGFAEYFGYFFPSLSTNNIVLSATIPIGRDGFQYSLSMGQVVAVLAITLLSGSNYIGAGLGKTVQNIITVIKIGTMVGFIVLGLSFGAHRGPIDFSFSSTSAGPDFSQILIGFGVALIAVSWAFDGWHSVNYVAGEIKAPRRNVPLTLILGTLIITSLCLLMNVVYLLALPVEDMSGVARVAEKATGAMFGGVSASLVSAAVLISTFGSLNGAIFVAPRVYYAMAKDELFFKKAAIVHPRFQTPSFAIVIQAVWASVLALSGTYEQLFTYVTFLNIVFWIAGTAAVFELRKKYPDLPRPYKTWGYPIESLAGLGLAVLGIPVYFHWKKKSS